MHPGWFTLEPPRSMRPAGSDRDIEVRVALPLSYHGSDRVFPTLWVTDNDLETALAVVGPREIILVGVGSPRTGPGYDPRRAWDYYPEPNILPLPPFRDFVLDRHPVLRTARPVTLQPYDRVVVYDPGTNTRRRDQSRLRRTGARAQLRARETARTD